MAKKNNEDSYMAGTRVKIGTSDKIIRGVGYVFVTLYEIFAVNYLLKFFNI